MITIRIIGNIRPINLASLKFFAIKRKNIIDNKLKKNEALSPVKKIKV
tara:strand:- start:54 stop:197 length:144 start_codon:yes stop_codon:yes gene_type:complete